MKKIASVLLAVLLCLICCAFASAEETDGQSAVMDFVGTYHDTGVRQAVMTIEAIGQENPLARIVIRLPGSGDEYAQWDMTGLLDPETLIITCKNGTKSLCSADQAGNITAIAENIMIDSEFVILEDESVTWTDHAENAGEGCRFVFFDGAWSFDDPGDEEDGEGSAVNTGESSLLF